MLALDSGGPGPRIGITVSSKIGNAVARNRVKRWIREVWRSAAADLPSVDLMVIARPAVLTTGLANMQRAFAAVRLTLSAPERAP